MRTSSQIGSILLALAVAGSVHGEDRAAARQAYGEAVKHYDLNQYAEALDAFKRAYWNYEDPVILFNIAQCHRSLNHKKEAIDAYRSYLRKAPEARNREEVQRIVADLEAAISREKAVSIAPPVGTLTSPTEAPRPAAPSPAPVTQPATVVMAPAPPPPKPTPVWKRPWLWGVIGSVAVAGLAVGLGVGLGTQPHPPGADAAVRF
jgi:tetratricopeptide (TPR) repeat protein